MNRRTALQRLSALAVLPLLPACSRAEVPPSSVGKATVKPLAKTAEAWRNEVSPSAWRVLFDENTEAAFSSPLNREKRDGTYVCAACRLPLFEAAHKFESGTGWPSFTQPIAGHLGTSRDFKLILPRLEYHCRRCGGHQGHVFDDGPPPRGERWCNNGVALMFVPKGESLPELRS